MAGPTYKTSYSAFISYSHEDKAFVRELYRRLDRDGVRCFFDEESIEGGDNWVEKLQSGIDGCEQIVFVLSPDFCNSDWAKKELTSAIADEPKRKLVPLIRRECSQLPTFPRFLRDVQAIEVSTDTLFEKNYARICKLLGGVPGEDVNTTDRTKVPPVGALPDRQCMPYRSLGDQFVGRVDALWALYDSLFRDGTTVLQGLGVVAGAGGLGKTQLAIEYAHRFGSAYPGGVYWVSADRGLAELLKQISAAAGIDVDGKAEESVQVEQIWRGLNLLHTLSLVILDNFPETGALRPYLPTIGRVHTIVTTRRQGLPHSTVRLNSLSAEEGIRLLNSGERQFGRDATPLVERLGGLPLALELARSYLNYRKDLSIAAVLKEMDAAGEIEALAVFATEYQDQLPSGHEADVAQTFQLSWNLAPEAARQVLRVIGELAPVPVPRKLLRIILKLPGESGMQDELGKNIAELERLSLVELDTAGDPKAHRLVHAFARHRNIVDEASPFDGCRDAIQEQVERTFQNPDGDTNRELELLVPHAEFLLATKQLSEKDTSYLLNRLGAHHRTMGRFTAARRAYSAALASDEKSNPPGHPDIATMQSNLALVLMDLGQLEEARDLLRKALASDEKSFAPGHPNIAIRQSGLALVLKDLGQLEEASDLLRKALASVEKSFAPGHPTIAKSQSNLALVLRNARQLEEARDLLRKALASDEKAFAPGHPNIATRQSNLALVLQDLGQLEQARDLLRKALSSNEKTFAPGHPYIARSQFNLAGVLKDLGQLDEARDLLRKAYASSLEWLGPDHPNTKTIKRNLDSLPPA